MRMHSAASRAPSFILSAERLGRLPARDILLHFEAAGWLGIARLAIELLPLRRIAPHLGQQGQRPGELSEAQSRVAGRVSQAVRRTGRRLPWRCACLTRALAAKGMLRCRGVPSTLFLGVARDGADLSAHAWLQSGDLVLTGTAEKERYTVISSFGGGGA